MNKLFFTLLLLALAASAYGQTQERIAIINTLDDYDSISVAELIYLTDKLREIAVNVLPKYGYGVMTTESIVAFLGSQERLVKVCKESSCLAELGRQVSADYVAQGRIGRFGKDLTIKVELYNVKTGNLIGSFAGYSKDIYGLLALIDEKAPDLFKNISSASNIAVVPPPQQEPPQQQSVNMDPRAKIQWYINKGFDKHKEDIQKEAPFLSYIDKTDLYDENKESNLGYFALNFIPGFGLGSYIQGDISSGIKLSVSDGVGWVLIIFGGGAGEGVIVVTGAALLGVSRIAGWICSFSYQSKYNKALREALNFDENVSFSIDPLIVPRDGTPAVGLAFNVRY